MAVAGRSGPPQRLSPLPALIPCIKGMRLRAPCSHPQSCLASASQGGLLVAGGAESGESKSIESPTMGRKVRPDGRNPEPDGRTGEGKDWVWRRGGEGPLPAPQHPHSSHFQSLLFLPPPIAGTLSSDPPPHPPNPISSLFSPPQSPSNYSRPLCPKGAGCSKQV